MPFEAAKNPQKKNTVTIAAKDEFPDLDINKFSLKYSFGLSF